MAGTGATRAPVAHMRREGTLESLCFSCLGTYIWHRNYLGDGDRPTASGGQPVVDLGPSTPPGDEHQPEPVDVTPPNDKKPDPSRPSDELPPPPNPDTSKGDTPASPGPPPPPPPPQKTGDSVTPPQKSEPDPGADETPTGVPIFL